MINIISVLADTLPPILWRHKWPDYQEEYGIPFSKGTMANFDYRGTGPTSSRIGGKICYTKKDYLDWLSNSND